MARKSLLDLPLYASDGQGRAGGVTKALGQGALISGQVNEPGTDNYTPTLDWADPSRWAGYTYDGSNSGDANALQIYDPSGKLYAGSDWSTAQSGFDKFGSNGGWLALMAGGAALAGAGGGAAGAAGSGAGAGGAAAGADGLAGLASSAGWSSAADSLAASNALGITGGQAAAAATMPATINMGALGGTTATSGGVKGLMNLAGQKIADATASDQIGGNLLSQAGQAVSSGTQGGTAGASDLAAWMKANPAAGKVLMSGLGGLLSASGGGSSPAAGGQAPGPAVQWNSPLTAGLLAPQQQAQQAPQSAGLLSGVGQANSGAWRFMRGK